MSEHATRLSHLIGGEAVAGGDHFESIDPYRGEVVCRAPNATDAEVAQAVAAAAAAAPEVAAIPAYERALILRRAGELIVERADEIGEVMARETGKAIKDARAEVRRSTDTMSLSAEEAIRIEGAHVPLDGSAVGHGKLAFLVRFPVGVVGAITPFNAPFNLACHKLGPALAAGNAVVIKPPQQCPMVVHKLVELLFDAGMPSHFVNVVHGGPDAGRALVRDERVSVITFTGSSRAGREIRAAAGLRRVALELGGNGPTIVCEDADLDAIAPQIARNAVRLAGQSCISVQNVFVPGHLANALAERVARAMAALRLGDPLDEATDVGTLIDEAAARRVEGWVADAVAHGAEVVTGGAREGAAFAPTLLRNVTTDMPVVCEEIFGPVANIVSYAEVDEAVRFVNASPYGLQCGVFTDSMKLGVDLARRIRAGGVILNGTSTWRTDQLAYGGVKDSGIGREGPRYAIRDMTEERLILFNL
ncbi:MAG: aldehyde dehydrogenase family protein [Gammaproteobacteria bacterium]|nr:aldehyde dehydrogenase family protein [Gammaproteobacteria bacterium]NIR90641.1 aldehyde dehydrogenase family protein [Gammaproteobacteria bacterium]NIU07021.1 aldehyde dehydrogenase family protein [Gammaproteobacteria bacterium]NIV53931.1 aldehyde dehydrogenase family protein [Gammaproteobacteria bacterium]NIW86161.1 aldehyde dehydrogenase family protein [Gammaproteobacteria bacterium]